MQLIFAYKLFSQQPNSTESRNREIALQAFNNTNKTIIFKLFAISDKQYEWEFNSNCISHEVSKDTSTLSITGNYFGKDIGYSIINSNQTFDDSSMYLGLNKILLTVNGEEYYYFLYDNRDCHYYAPCPGNWDQDITIRVNGDTGHIWYHKNHITTPGAPSTSTGWKPITDDKIEIWVERGMTHCPLGAPNNPTNLTVSGGIGDHPLLTWDANDEPDVDGYNIYQKIGNTSYNLLTNVYAPTTSYTDNGVTITGGKFDPTVYYKITAFDFPEQLESSYSNVVTVKSNNINKSTNNIWVDTTKVDYFISETFPNPFNPSTTFYYGLAKDGHVLIRVFDVLGNKVATLINKYQSKGEYSVNFDATFLSSGIYYYSIITDGYFASRKMLLAK